MKIATEKLKSALNVRGRRSVFAFPSRTRAVAAPLQITTDGVLGCFLLDPLNWELLTLDERVLIWDQQRAKYGQLAEAMDDPGGRSLQIRRTTRPYPAFQWAQEIDAMCQPLPDSPGGSTWTVWNSALTLVQTRLRSTGLDPSLTALWVWLAPPPSPEAFEDLTSDTDHPRIEAARALDRLAETTGILAGGALSGRPATADEMALLMHRSYSMGLPAPANLAAGGDLSDQFGPVVDRSEWFVDPAAREVELRGEVDAEPTTRHVVVMSMGDLPEQTWPESGIDAWMVASDRLGIPVEWTANGRLLKGSDVEPLAVRDGHLARAIEAHYAEHGMIPPPAVARAIAQATDTLDQVTAGNTRSRPRWEGTIRAAVAGATQEEATAQARKLAGLYSEAMNMSLTRTKGQGTKLREFVPGEPRESSGYTRRMSVGYLAAAMPNIDAEVGTPAGPYLGYTSVSHRAWLWDFWYGPAVNRSGLIRIIGGQGSGKSVVLGMAAYWATLMGAWTTLYDPSGTLSKSLLAMPELVPYARELNLGRAGEGELTPHAMIPAPALDDFTNEDGTFQWHEYKQENDAAKMQRRELLVDTLKMMLSPDLVRAPGLATALTDAVAAMAGHDHAQGVDQARWNPRWALEALHAKRDEDVCARAWRELEAASEYAKAVVPKHNEPVEASAAEDSRLTLITMPGLPGTPIGIPKEDWLLAERYAQPLMHLSTFRASRSVYLRPRHDRKAVLVDEAYQMLLHASGRAMINRQASDTRKRNAAVFVASQFDADVMASERLTNLFGANLIGRCESDESAVLGCRSLGVSPEYAPVLMGLESGQFAHQDVTRRAALVQADMGWNPSFAALNTTPQNRRKDADQTVRPQTIDPRLLKAPM